MLNLGGGFSDSWFLIMLVMLYLSIILNVTFLRFQVVSESCEPIRKFFFSNTAHNKNVIVLEICLMQALIYI